MFWKRKKKPVVKPVVKPARSEQENLEYMASLGMSPSYLLQYQNLCKDIKEATDRRS